MQLCTSAILKINDCHLGFLKAETREQIMRCQGSEIIFQIAEVHKSLLEKEV